MIIYTRQKPFPMCKYCGNRMGYWIIGQKDEDASHPECYGKFMANKVLENLKHE